jgi:hypothetical protein
LFDIFGFTVEIGDVPWGGETNEQILADQFDEVINNGGVYHLMCHPGHIKDDWYNDSYLHHHLTYISDRNNLWYTTLGYLYLYQRYINSGPQTLSVDKIETQNLPEYFILRQNYPNPFNPWTTIEFELAQETTVKLEIYDLIGNHISTLINNNYNVGKYSVLWDGKNTNGENVGSGIYYYKMTTKDFVKTQKMLLLR